MKTFIIWMLLGQGADLSTTLVGLKKGCREVGILGQHMTGTQIAAVKGGVMVGITLTLGRKPEPTKVDKAIVGVFAATGTAAAVWNLTQIPRC